LEVQVLGFFGPPSDVLPRPWNEIFKKEEKESVFVANNEKNKE
jgi:hypothetical protein